VVSIVSVVLSRHHPIPPAVEAAPPTNDVAHELPRFAVDPDATINTDLLTSARGCLRTVCLFWGRITVDSNEESDGRHIADDAIMSPMVELLDYLIDLAGVGPPR